MEGEPTEKWQPGEVDIDKLTKSFPYLVASGFTPPPRSTLLEPFLPPEPRPPDPSSGIASEARLIAASARGKHTRRLERRQAHREQARQEANAVEEAITQAMLDSGASKTFINSHRGLELTGLSNKTVVTANGSELPASNTALLNTTALSKGAREALIVPGMQQKALMSVATLADNGYTVVFSPGQQGVAVYRSNDVIVSPRAQPALQGWRDSRGLWVVPITDNSYGQHRVAKESSGKGSNDAALSVYELPSTAECVRFLHAALGFPTKATLLTAARHGNLVTFPNMSPENINKHFPECDETAKGHMRQTRQGVRSTKVVDEDAMLLASPSPGVKHKDVYLRVFDSTKKTLYTDQTGRFPITSARGNKYIMVAVELDGNYIDAEPISARTAKALTDAYQSIFQRWKATGAVNPNWHILDNEAPEELKQAIRDNKCRVELTPADQHRRNMAERAIQTFKGHFISVLAGVDAKFPINQWDELLPQTILTLNLLRQSNVAPNVSAWAYHHGNFDYNRMPIAPMGCAVQFHIKPSRRKTFGEHSEDGFYLRTSPEHYRTHVIFVKKTRAKRLADTVFFKHKYITQPTVTPADAIVNAYTKLTQAIRGIREPDAGVHIEALERMQALFTPSDNQPDKSSTPLPPPKADHRNNNNNNNERTNPSPRVTFDTKEPEVREIPSRLVVALPQEQIVQPTKQAPVIKPEPILHRSKYIADPNDSIAARVHKRRAQSSTEDSIAARVAQRRREAAHSVLDQETGELLEYRQLLRHPRFKEVWNRSAADEFGRLAQGIGGRIKGTDTIQFIHKHEVPADRFKDVTYIKFVCSIRTEKKDPYRTRATMGGNLINYPDDVGTPTANLLLIKIFLNSVISTPGARFATADISNFYLMTPLKRPEYAKIKLSDIPDEVIKEYRLHEKATPDGWVYIKAIRGMYGLPQSGSLGHDLLEQRLNQEGYYQSRIVPGLWRHNTKAIQFVLVVDDFGIKYLKKEDLDHLVQSLQKYYEVTVDMTGKEYVKIELDWDYEHRQVHLSMAPYLQKALRQFDNLVPTQRQDSPYPHIEPKYGAKQQLAAYDTSDAVGKKEQQYVQQVTGKFNWYARAVDPTMLTPLSAIAAQQSKPTQATMKQVQQFLDYAATQEPAVTTYRASDMILGIHSDAGYLNEQQAQSRQGGHHFLSENVQYPDNNGAVHNEASIIKAVMSSAAEAELGALYTNARKGVEERNILEAMGHPQPSTPVQTDNSTADGIINARIQPKRTKAMDMRFHWLRDRGVNQNQFRFYWRPGALQRADYYTKHHSPAHHRNMRSEILTPYNVVTKFREKLRNTP